MHVCDMVGNNLKVEVLERVARTPMMPRVLVGGIVRLPMVVVVTMIEDEALHSSAT